MLTHEKLLELYYYRDGNLYRKTSRGRGAGRWKPDSVVGYKLNGGYIGASVDHKKYKLHSLIWMWHHGVFPKQLDHIDRNPANNRIENLREVTTAQNAQNHVVPRVNNKVGSRGVYKQGSKYRVQLTTNGKVKHIGYFFTVEEAALAYEKARKENHPFFME